MVRKFMNLTFLTVGWSHGLQTNFACATELSGSRKGLLIVAKCIQYRQHYRSLEDYI